MTRPLGGPKLLPSLSIHNSRRSTRCRVSSRFVVLALMKNGLVYVDAGAEAYDAQHRTHILRRLRQRAANLGFGLVNLTTGEITEGIVS